MSTRLIKKLGIFCILGICINAIAVEKVVWCPKDKIGKNETWNSNAEEKLNNDALEIKFTGSGWSGVGLNWESYWPTDAGVKISDFKYLIIQLKVTGEANALAVTLKDNKKKTSGNVSVKKYCPDGKVPTEYATIKIPIQDFLNEKSKMETGVVWEIIFSVWSEGEKNVTASVNKIAFSKD